MDEATPRSLRDMQRWMKARIEPGGAVATDSGEDPLNAQRGTPGRERLAVYAGGYLARVHQALGEVYEAVHRVLGDGGFNELSRAYAQRYPSHDYNLSLAGRHLPELLAADPLTQRLPFLPDLARLEWLVCRAFHAAQAPALEPSQLTALPLEAWERARLYLQPAVGLLASAWPILDIWQARARPRGTLAIHVVNRPQRVLVFRDGVHVRCELLDAGPYVLLEGLLAGQSLGAVCGTLAAEPGGEALPVMEWFSRWMALGLIVRCEVAAGPAR